MNHIKPLIALFFVTATITLGVAAPLAAIRQTVQHFSQLSS